ncbi:MAG: hypothetical protein ACI9L6_000953 [Flavobacterium sp.]|jgi:hypothetical protein
MNKILVFLGFISLLLISGCSNDDDLTKRANNAFLSGALTSATNQQLEGRWALFQIEFESKITDVPESFPECGKDFFDFQAGGGYREYTFDDNFECTPQINILSWTLSNGIITASNGTAIDRWVITELTANRLVFKFQFDVDLDGKLELFKAICNRYEPPVEIDIYSGTFYWNKIENNDKIVLKWDAYRGYNQFEKYEIYRLDASCNAASAKLISTITDINQSSFIDVTPPTDKEICYLFKVYTNKGLLGESSPVNVKTSDIEVSSVNLSQPSLNNSIVNLNWERYEGYYFSHYEIEVRNYSSGSGGGYQEEQLVVINNIETLNYSVELPYFANPVFVIHVYNIFGKRSQTVIPGQNQRSTNFVRKGILPIDSIQFTAFSPNESILYYSNYSRLYKYNYTSNSVEGSTELNSSSIVFVKVFESSFGTEVIVNTGSEIKVYDTDLNFKYNLTTSIFSSDHLAVTNNGFWLITDRKNLYSFSRTNNKLALISTNNLYKQSFSSSTINVIDLGQNRILAGNYTKSQGLVVDIDANGVLSNAVPVNMNATSQWKNNSLYSENRHYLLNIEDNTLYSTKSYDLVTTLSQDFFLSGVSNDGSLILGTKNNPIPSNSTFHEKKVRTLNYPSLKEQTYNAKGYPHVVYQNHLGQLVSISKGLIGSLKFNSVEHDIFIEIIE